jgi:type II secretory pathway pseudopilin PulG
MSKKNEINKYKRGFTQTLRAGAGFMLLEVILSVLVVSVGVVFVINSFITSIKAFKVSKVYVEALYLIEQKLWDYEEKGKIEDGRDSGKFDDYKNAEWEIEAREIEGLPLNETTAEVTMKTDTEKRRFKVTTYFNKEE